MNNRYNMLILTALAALLLLTGSVYWPGITGPLLLDDVVNLSTLGNGGGVNNWQNLLQFALGNESGPLGRPVAMLSFLIDAQYWPPVVASFKYTNVMLHLVTGLLFCWTAILIFRAMGLAQDRAALLGLLCAALWLLSPLNLSTTLYVVQRMTQLMALFGLLALIFFIKGMACLQRDGHRALCFLCVSLFPFALLALLSKENGALLLVLMLVLRVTVFKEATFTGLAKYWERLALFLPCALMLVFLLYRIITGLDAFAYRPFTAWERLLTESRILFDYLFKFLVPVGRDYGLFHDDYGLSTGLLSPAVTIVAITAWAGIIYCGFKLRAREPMLALAIFWFLGMHLIESTMLPLELYFEHRNYMAIMGPIIAFIWYGARCWDRLHTAGQRVMVALPVVALLIGTSVVTYSEAALWGDTDRLFEHWAESKPESVRAQSSYADYLAATGRSLEALAVIETVRAQNPDDLALMLQSWSAHCVVGLTPQIGLSEIARQRELSYYQGNGNLLVRRIIENIQLAKCNSGDITELPPLIERMLELPQRTYWRANLYRLYSEVYVALGDLNGALIQLSNAFDIEPVVDIPIRQATLTASAGNYSDALIFLDRARAADAASGGFTPSRREQIQQLESEFRSLMQ